MGTRVIEISTTLVPVLGDDGHQLVDEYGDLRYHYEPNQPIPMDSISNAFVGGSYFCTVVDVS